jgi:hypothetical protein
LFCLEEHRGNHVFSFWPFLEVALEEGVRLMGACDEERLVERQDGRELLREVEGRPSTILFQQMEISRRNRVPILALEARGGLAER